MREQLTFLGTFWLKMPRPHLCMLKSELITFEQVKNMQTMLDKN